MLDDVSQIDLASTEAPQGHGARSQTSSRESLPCERFKAAGVQRFISQSDEELRRRAAMTSSGPSSRTLLRQKKNVNLGANLGFNGSSLKGLAVKSCFTVSVMAA